MTALWRQPANPPVTLARAVPAVRGGELELVDRLVHRSEIIELHVDSYRLEEAKERNASKTASRRAKQSRP